MAYLLFLLHYLKLYLSFLKQPKHYKAKQQTQKDFFPYKKYISNRKKPLWVKYKIIYLKALLPNHGCRKIAIIFNKQNSHKNISVSKSYAYNIIKNHHYKIVQKRKDIKTKIPKKLPNNLLWQIDITNISNIDKNRNNILGIVDSGSRAIVFLQRLKDKSSITILRYLLDTLEKYGKPKTIKTDNEIIFTSKLFTFFLWILNIKHQTTHIASPWENGKIERFF